MSDDNKMWRMNVELERLAYDWPAAETEEEQETIRKQILELIGAMEDKAEAYLCVIDRLTLEMEASLKFAEAHRDRAKSYEKSLDRLRSTLTDTMRVQYETQGVKEMRSSAGRWIRYYPESTNSALEIDEDALPDDWFKETRVPRKADIRRALKEGQEIPGVDLKEWVEAKIRVGR